MKLWKDEEVKDLFMEVEKCKSSDDALRFAFSKHAEKYNRQPNSVRNYYYHEVDNLAKDEARCKKLNINLTAHQKTHFQNFDKLQEANLFEEIQKECKNGNSVRGACLKLSGGDLSKMTRLQNKYQNMKRKLDKLQKEDLSKNNIIQFKAQKILTDSDINSLFLGLVKLIKKTAEQEAEVTVKAFENLKSEYEKLKSENAVLKLKIKSNKKQDLKEYIGRKSGVENFKKFDNI